MDETSTVMRDWILVFLGKPPRNAISLCCNPTLSSEEEMNGLPTPPHLPKTPQVAPSELSWSFDDSLRKQLPPKLELSSHNRHKPCYSRISAVGVTGAPYFELWSARSSLLPQRRSGRTLSSKVLGVDEVDWFRDLIYLVSNNAHLLQVSGTDTLNPPQS
jgi:hypothetical protein